MDVFETLKSMVGCMYISDLKFRPYREMAMNLLKDITIDSTQIADVYSYLGI